MVCVQPKCSGNIRAFPKMTSSRQRGGGGEEEEDEAGEEDERKSGVRHAQKGYGGSCTRAGERMSRRHFWIYFIIAGKLKDAW